MDNPSRRQILAMGAAGVALAATSGTAAETRFDRASPALVARAQAAMAKHRSRIRFTDRIAVADFSQPSRQPRFSVIDMANGRMASHLVAHGRGSDPSHTGWLSRFSNVPGSLASSDGAYLTGEIYHGVHGRAMRLAGLDSVNCNAEARAIVIHAAWYVSPQLAREKGRIGRSEGCFAVTDQSLNSVLAELGPGRLLYADKV